MLEQRIANLETITREFVERLQVVQYEDIVAFVEEREACITEINELLMSSDGRDRYKTRIQDVIELDGLILKRAEALMQEANNQIQKLSTAKTQKNAYNTGYLQESYFFDKRK